MKSIIKSFTTKLVTAYLTDMYASTNDKVLKGAITKVLQKI